LIVVLALVVLQDSFRQSAQGVSDVQLKKCQISAQQDLACFDGGVFNGSKPFDLLGYQANPVLCNCSDFDPDAFTIPVGMATSQQLEFYTDTTTPTYSALKFEDSTKPAYIALSLRLKTDSYRFHQVLPDRTSQEKQPDATKDENDGHTTYSWNSVAAGSKIKIIPKNKPSSPEEQSQANTQKQQEPSAQEQEQNAAKKTSKTVDENNQILLINSKEGKNTLIYQYTPTDIPAEDYKTPFTLTIPVKNIAKTFPPAESITPNPDDSESTDITWSNIRFQAGKPFTFTIHTNNPDYNTLTTDIDTGLQRLKNQGKTLTKTQSKKTCPELFGITLPGCSDSNNQRNLPTATPAENPALSPTPKSLELQPSPTPSCLTLPLLGTLPFGCTTPTPTPNPDSDEYLQENQGCSILPGGKNCASGLECQLQLSLPPTSQCKRKTDATPTPTATPSPSPSAEPSKKPPIDLSQIKIEAVKPWQWNEVETLKTPTPTPTIQVAIEAEEPKCTTENHEPVDAPCCTRLQALAEDPQFANSRNLCQKPDNAKVYQAPMSRLSFADPTPSITPTTTPTPASIKFKSKAIPAEELSTEMNFEPGFDIPENGFIRGGDGNLYIAVAQRAILHNNQWAYLDAAYEYGWAYSTFGIAMSGDNGKTWNFLGKQTQQPADGSGSFVDTIDGNAKAVHLDHFGVSQGTAYTSTNRRSMSRFEGIVPAPDGGVYLYYSTASEMNPLPAIPQGCPTNGYAFRAMHASADGFEDTPVQTPPGVFLKFLNTNGTDYFFESIQKISATAGDMQSDAYATVLWGKDISKIYESEDGTTLKDTGTYLSTSETLPAVPTTPLLCAPSTISCTPGYYTYDNGKRITCTRQVEYYLDVLGRKKWRYIYLCDNIQWNPEYVQLGTVCTPETAPSIDVGPPIRPKIPLQDLRLSPTGTKAAFWKGQLYVQKGKYFEKTDVSTCHPDISHPTHPGCTYEYLAPTEPAWKTVTLTDGLPLLVDSQFDSFGNLHLIETYEVPATSERDLYYEMIPAKKIDPQKAVAFDSVTLITRPNCPDCDAVENFLNQNGIPYKKSVQQIIQTANANKKYPITNIQTGGKISTVTGWDRIGLAEKIGIQIPIEKVTRYPKRPEQKWESSYSAVDMPAAPRIMIQENDKPAILFETPSALKESNPKKEIWETKTLTEISLPTSDNDLKYKYQVKVNSYWQAYYAARSPSFILRSYPAIVKDEDIEFLQYNKTEYRTNLNLPAQYNIQVAPRFVQYDYVHARLALEEPEAGAILNELVPFHKFRIPIPISAATTPTLTVESNLAEIIAASAKPSEGTAHAYEVELVFDARKYLLGGKLNLPVDKVEGTIWAETEDKQAEIPFKIPVKHVAPENLAYVTPEVLPVYTNAGKGVTKPVFLANNYNRPLTLSCGALFTRVVAPGTVTQVDVKPPATTTECTVSLDGVATRQTFRAEVRPVDDDSPWITEDGLSESLELTEDASFRDCAGRYCNCQQARQAADDFATLVSSHVSRINGASPRDSINEVYPSGYTASTVLRTGTFDDMDDPLGECNVKFNAYEQALQPGSVYKVGFKVPQAGGWLSWDHAVPTQPVELVKQWTYVTNKGLAADKDGFRGTIS